MGRYPSSHPPLLLFLPHPTYDPPSFPPIPSPKSWPDQLVSPCLFFIPSFVFFFFLFLAAVLYFSGIAKGRAFCQRNSIAPAAGFSSSFRPWWS